MCYKGRKRNPFVMQKNIQRLQGRVMCHMCSNENMHNGWLGVDNDSYNEHVIEVNCTGYLYDEVFIFSFHTFKRAKNSVQVSSKPQNYIHEITTFSSIKNGKSIIFIDVSPNIQAIIKTERCPESFLCNTSILFEVIDFTHFTIICTMNNK